ncbi:MAG: phosphoenolpyruvate carboxykinase (ATP), partial [Bacteroidetes bacterium]
FSACFGAAFLLLHPTVYAQELVKKMKEHGSTAYLVNTGWIGGPPGVGNRMDLPSTRKIIDSIINGVLDDVEYEQTTYFQLYIPKSVPGCPAGICNPKNAWEDQGGWDLAALKLAQKFIDNFEEFTDTEEGKRLVAAGPQL